MTNNCFLLLLLSKTDILHILNSHIKNYKQISPVLYCIYFTSSVAKCDSEVKFVFLIDE